MRMILLFLLLTVRAFAADYPFVNDFPAFSPPPDWYGGQYRNVIVDDLDSVTIFFFEALPHPTFNQNSQVFYRRFDKFGHAALEPRFVTDSSLYQARSSIQAGHNRKGKWVIANRVLYNCPEWPHCEEDLRASVSNANGSEIDTEIVVGHELGQPYRNSNGAAAVDSAGNFVIAWGRFGSLDFPWSGGILYQLFWADGTPRTQVLWAADSVMSDGTTLIAQRTPQIAMSPEGDFVITWQCDCSGPSCVPEGWSPKTFMRLFHADGTPKTEEIRVCDVHLEEPINTFYPDVAMADDGRFAISYSRINELCEGQYNTMPYVKRYDADGNALGPEIVLDSLYCTPDFNLATFISCDSAFNLMVGWQNNNAGLFNGQYANLIVQRLDSEGNLIGPRYRINDRADQAFMLTTPVAMNNNGLAAFFWGEMKPDKANTTLDRMQLMSYNQVGIYHPGDADNNNKVNVSDVVYVINYVFAGGQAPATQCLADANGDQFVSISDAVTLINYIFAGGAIAGSCL